MADLLEPKAISIKTMAGEEKNYTISKVPAIPCREIIAKYPLSNMPKLGDYEVSEEIMLKLMCYVGVEIGDQILPLKTREMVNNHVPDWETLARIEVAMLEYNTSFFGRAASLISFDDIEQKARRFLTKILTDLSAQSSPKKQPRSKN